MTIKPLVLISDFVTTDHGKYIVKVSIYSDGTILGSALAGEDTVEKAEDSARKRAIALVNKMLNINVVETPAQISDVKSSPKISNVDVSLKTQSPKKEATKIKTSVKSIKTEEKLISPNYIDVGEKNTPSPPEDEANMTINDDEISLDNLTNNDDYKEENSSELFLNIKSPENAETLNLFESKSIKENNDHSQDNFDNNLILFPMESQEENSSSETTLSLADLGDTIDFSQIIDQTSIEMKRLEWTQDQGKKYLLETYGKKSRHLLSDEELIEFLQYLKTQ
ncbi:hypothetical protein [Geminocystis sp. GBBB08]|uniref:hypothetical protein n=1 Tax=Geminocystis sp. GBBB08 TaxID=2604140 RepID=UPI0027E30A1C|nr:hypothetical protein [Geminocystis sp. GBBB08]MBL1209432.1 hypothetical protein [Geminocystis sp. GBBB08]